MINPTTTVVVDDEFRDNESSIYDIHDNDSGSINDEDDDDDMPSSAHLGWSLPSGGRLLT